MANEFYKKLEEESTMPGYIVQEHRTMICGLTKHEYIALELAKAWSNTKRSYYEPNEVVDWYEKILKEVKERNL